MSTVTVDDLRKEALQLMERVAAGEHLLVTHKGQPLAEIHPVPPTAKNLRPYGLAAGELVVPEDFDAPLPENVLKDFEGQ